MISIRKIASTLCSFKYGRPSYMFMKGLEQYQKVYPPMEETALLFDGLADKLINKQMTDQQLIEMIQKKQFQNQIYNIVRQELNEEYSLDLDEDISKEQEDRLNKLQQEILKVLESSKLDSLNRFQLYEQTLMLDEVQKHFMTKILKNDNLLHKKTLRALAELLCKQHHILFAPSKNSAPALDLQKFMTLVQNFQRKDVLQNLSLVEVALLLDIDYVLFKKELQSQLIAQALNMILSIKKFDTNQHSKALNLIFRFVRVRRLKLGQDARVILHLIEVLPIKELNSIMQQVKITNYEYADVIKIYAAMQKKYFSTYNVENIPLLSTMNVYMPAMTAANFYLNHLQVNFDQGNYFELMTELPDFINLFYPKHQLVSYISDRLQVKLSTSNYSIIDADGTKQQKIHFLKSLSNFLISLLHANLIKNDFFLIKTLLFVNNNHALIKDKTTLNNFTYFFNQIYENSSSDETPLNPNIKEQIEQFNNIYPPRQSLAAASNTETKIFKFLLQTNHFALQNVRVGSFNIDILVHPDLIVEYNGYDHYRFDLKSKGYNLEQFTLKHLYREKQLKKLKSYKIANINFKQWNVQYDLDKQYNFLRNLVLSFE